MALVPGAAQEEATHRVAIMVENMPEGFALREVRPAEVEVTVAGSRRAMLLARAATLQAAGRTNEALETYRDLLTHQSATKGQKNTAKKAIEAIAKRQ